MKLDSNARYNKSHEWARKQDDIFVIGISDYAQSSLSDVVYVELPEVGDEVTQGEAFGVIESVKAAADVYAPLSGEVVAINEALEDEPERVNEDAFGSGWLMKVKATNPESWSELLDAAGYEKAVAAEES
jgi:glycine cleavage system H protein